MRRLEEKPSDRTLGLGLIVGLVLFAVSYVLFVPYLAVLAKGGYSIVDQQLIFNYAGNEKILAAWKAVPDGIDASLMCAYIDLFMFMPAYVVLFFTWGILTARHGFEKTRGLGIVCALCILPAWLADIIETSIQTIISLIVNGYLPALVPIMSTAAVVKFAFFYAALIWCLAGTISIVIKKLKSRWR